MGLEKQLEKLTHAVDIMTQDFDMLVRSFSEFNEQLMLQKKTFLNDVAISAEDIIEKHLEVLRQDLVQKHIDVINNSIKNKRGFKWKFFAKSWINLGAEADWNKHQSTSAPKFIFAPPRIWWGVSANINLSKTAFITRQSDSDHLLRLRPEAQRLHQDC